MSNLLDLSTAERVMVAGNDIESVVIGGQRIWDRPTLYTPWTETRRNLVSDPRGVTATAAYWQGNPAVVSQVDGAPFGEQFAIQFQGPANGAQRGGFVVPDLTAGQLYTVRFAARGSQERTNWSVQYRSSLLVTTGQTVVAPSAQVMGADVREYEYTFTPIQSGPGWILGIFNTAGFTNEYFQVTRAQVDLGDTRGQGFFDGASIPVNPELQRYRWLGTPNASPSVLETREVMP